MPNPYVYIILIQSKIEFIALDDDFPFINPCTSFFTPLKAFFAILLRNKGFSLPNTTVETSFIQITSNYSLTNRNV